MFRADTTISRQARTSCSLITVRILIAALLLLSHSVSAPAAEDTEAQYRVKAAFIYNFARFTSWPAHDGSEFRLCILGTDPLGKSLDALIGKQVHQESVTIIRLEYASTLDQCELVYIASSYSDQLAEVISQLEQQAILTVSDIDAFIDHGGIIGFRIIDNRIRFEINASAATKAGLTISSRLLSLASRVRMDR